MVFASNKPSKMCPFCKAEIKNLGMHISNKHPSAWSKIDDSPILSSNIETSPPRKDESLTSSISPQAQYRSVSEMVKDKLDTMLNLKIIQMLEKGVSVEEINRIMQPPQPQQTNNVLDEIKKYREIQNLFGNKEVIPEVDNTSEWLSLANNAIPLIKEMLPNKQESVKNDRYTELKEGNIPTNRDIQQQAAGDSTQSGSSSKESGILIRTEREDNKIVAISDKRDV